MKIEAYGVYSTGLYAHSTGFGFAGDWIAGRAATTYFVERGSYQDGIVDAGLRQREFGVGKS